MKKWILFLFLFIFLTGCSSITGEHDFRENIDSIEQMLEEPDWKNLVSHGNKLKKLYEQNKWKLQLLGDEGEYESLQENIHVLIVAIEEKDVPEIKYNLASIKTYLEDIYSF